VSESSVRFGRAKAFAVLIAQHLIELVLGNQIDSAHVKEATAKNVERIVRRTEREAKSDALNSFDFVRTTRDVRLDSSELELLRP
jgi:hypothetical protein